jgi:hypothetical protein
MFRVKRLLFHRNVSYETKWIAFLSSPPLFWADLADSTLGSHSIPIRFARSLDLYCFLDVFLLFSQSSPLEVGAHRITLCVIRWEGLPAPAHDAQSSSKNIYSYFPNPRFGRRKQSAFRGSCDGILEN